jgi:hypothetical protein
MSLCFAALVIRLLSHGQICKLQGRTGSYPLLRSLIAQIVRYHFVGIEGAHCRSVSGGGEPMEWARILATSVSVS